jgi:hypothetical protein
LCCTGKDASHFQQQVDDTHWRKSRGALHHHTSTNPIVIEDPGVSSTLQDLAPECWVLEADATPSRPHAVTKSLTKAGSTINTLRSAPRREESLSWVAGTRLSLGCTIFRGRRLHQPCLDGQLIICRPRKRPSVNSGREGDFRVVGSGKGSIGPQSTNTRNFQTVGPPEFNFNRPFADPTTGQRRETPLVFNRLISDAGRVDRRGVCRIGAAHRTVRSTNCVFPVERDVGGGAPTSYQKLNPADASKAQHRTQLLVAGCCHRRALRGWHRQGRRSKDSARRDMERSRHFLES